jgi:hypothetical protein
MNYLRIKYSLAFAAFLLIIQGCGIFDTREPEPPETVRSTFIPPTSADIVVDNLGFSIQEKNSENYIKCLSSMSYQYVPDSKSQLLYEQIFLNWNQPAEKFYLDNLISQTDQTSSSVLFLDNERFTQISSDSATLQADYIFVFQHNNTSIPKSGNGNILLTIATDENSLFYIRKWEDFRQNDTDFTWSEFKAKFSN